MHSDDRKQVWRESLVLMRNALIRNYDQIAMTADIPDTERDELGTEDVLFQSLNYRLNDGRRRVLDAVEVLDRAIEQMDHLSTQDALRLYLSTLKEVILLSNLAKILEESILYKARDSDLLSWSLDTTG